MAARFYPPRHCASAAFTLIELMVSTAIMLVVILVLLQVIAGMTNIWHNSTGTISSFESARAAFTTMTRTLSRATLKTYIDYTNDPTANNPPFGYFRTTGTSGNEATFVPSQFARNSELHFISGPTTAVAGVTGVNYPGDCVFFQAPEGIVSISTDKYLTKSLDNFGFYVTYTTSMTATNTMPTWLRTALGLGTTTATPRFRLMECVEPAENLHTYNDINGPGTAGPWTAPTTYTSAISYINFVVSGGTGYLQGQVGKLEQNVVLADNVVLLVFRPRVEPEDEQTLAGTGGVLTTATPSPITYSQTTAGSIISPNYNYDSRAWWGGYGATIPTTRILNTTYAKLMRDQLPPIMDVAMVAVDANSIIHLGTPTTLLATSPLVPQTSGPYASPFTNSANLDTDLAAFGGWLSSNHVRYRIFRSSIQMETAAWVNN